MKQIYFYSFLFIVLILQACSFEPKGEHLVKVNSTPDLPNIEVSLNFDSDTLYVPRTNSITFDYVTTRSDVIWSKLIINENEIYPMTYSKDTIKKTWLYNGVAGVTGTLEMQILYKTKNGSLAEDGGLFKKKWIMKIVEYNQMASKITKTEFVDGSLKLDWTKYPGSSFKSYKIYKNVEYASQSLQLVATITSGDQTTYTDNTYHGESSVYYILTNKEFRGPIYKVKGPIPTLSSTATMSGDIILEWTKPPFYKNLRGYRISVNDKKLGAIQLADISNSTTESFTVTNPLFGEGKLYFLTLLPLTNSYLNEANAYSEISTGVFASCGLPSPQFSSALAGLAPITYMRTNDYRDGVIVFDQQKMTTVRRIKNVNGIFRFNVSANNKYLIGYTGIYQTLYFENLLDTTKSKTIVFKNYTQMSPFNSVSDLGTGIIINGMNAIVYDYLNEQKLAEITLHSNANDNRISPSGNFFCCTTSNSYFIENYRYKDNQITLLPAGNLATDPLYYYDYLPGTNEKLVLVKYNRIEVVDCNTWVTEHTWQLPNGFTEFYNLDKKSGKVLFREKNKLILFDVISGTRVELRDIAGDPDSRNPWTLFYNNGLLLSGNSNAIN